MNQDNQGVDVRQRIKECRMKLKNRANVYDLEEIVDAAGFLEKIGPTAKTAVPDLVWALKRIGAYNGYHDAPLSSQEIEEQDKARASIVRALGKIVPALPKDSSEARCGIHAIRYSFKDSLGRTRQFKAAIQARANIGMKEQKLMFGEIRKYVERLGERIHYCSEDERSNLSALLETTREAGLALSPLPISGFIRRLKDGDIRIRIEAIKWLGAMGSEAKPAVPILVNKLNEKNGDVRTAAVEALNKITGRNFGEDVQR